MTPAPVLHLDDPVPIAALLDLLAAHQDDLGRYAAEQVCRPDGFRPSPACLLAPLGGALGSVRAQIETVSADLAASWRELAEGVRRSADQLDRVEDALAHDLARLLTAAGGAG